MQLSISSHQLANGGHDKINRRYLLCSMEDTDLLGSMENTDLLCSMEDTAFLGSMENTARQTGDICWVPWRTLRDNQEIFVGFYGRRQT